MSEPWYATFFEGPALELWRRACPPEQTASEVAFIADRLDLRPGHRVLDVPCGNGRHALELAAGGSEVTGVDLCREFLDEGRGAAKQRGLEVSWIEGDMRELPGDGSFDGAVCLGNSFGYLEHEGTVRFLEAVAGSLRPGGRFVLETGGAAESLLSEAGDRAWMRLGDMLLLVANTYRIDDAVMESELTFVLDGHVDTRTAYHHVYTVAELRRMLVAAGLHPIEQCGSPDGEPYELGHPRLFLVAEK